MARILGIDVPSQKRIVISLQYIYGIGLTRAKEILNKANISGDIRTKDLTEDQLVEIRKIASEYKTEGDLRRDTALDIKRLMEIGCYRGSRHKKSLPVRGQKSKTNARTRKGPRKSVSGKKA